MIIELIGQLSTFKIPVTTYTAVQARVNNTNSVTHPVIVFKMTSNCLRTHFSDLVPGERGVTSTPGGGLMFRKMGLMGEEEISSPPEVLIQHEGERLVSSVAWSCSLST